jgi:hypothetical protein
MKHQTSVLLRELGLLCMIFSVMHCDKDTGTSSGQDNRPDADYYAPKTTSAITIDGQGNETAWQKAEWGAMDQLWISWNGEEASPADFSGRYKIVWDKNALYLLVEITDDMLSDIRTNPLNQYWEDDCLEIFIDEDASGGDHTYNYNAFAYHVALNFQVVDIGPDRSPHLYTDHVTAARTSDGTLHTWELAITVFTSSYLDSQGTDSPKADLKVNKKIGYLCAYCDSDQSGNREHFYGSNFIPGPVGEARNLGWQTADVFGSLALVE